MATSEHEIELVNASSDYELAEECDHDDDQAMLLSSPPPRNVDSSGNELLEESPQMVTEHAGNTPAITKMKQSRKDFQVYSPSDQLVSPCTRKLEKCRLGGGIAFSHPQHILRSRQHEGVQLAVKSNSASSTNTALPISSSSSSTSTTEPVPLAEPLELKKKKEQQGNSVGGNTQSGN